jgi:tetratricopeptide (TPR) repeat protein
VLVATGCIPRDPTNVYDKSASYRQAEALFTQKRFADSREKFRAVVSSPLPQDQAWSDWARFYMARCDHLTGLLSEAVVAYSDLLRIPRFPRLDIQVLAARGDINLETGNLAGALHDYSRARSILERNGGMVEIPGVDREKLLFGEAMTVWSMGNYRDSDRLFDRCLADYPNGRFVKEARSRHSRIGGNIRPTVSFYVQVGGLFRVQSLADQYAAKVRAKGFQDVVVEKRESASDFIYVVKVGAFETRQEAHAQKQELETAGFRPGEVRP